MSTLVILAGYDDGEDKPAFRDELKAQIATLKKQLNETPSVSPLETNATLPGSWNTDKVRLPSTPERTGIDIRLTQQRRIWDADPRLEQRHHPLMPGELPTGEGDGGNPERAVVAGRDMRTRALAAAALKRSFLF